MRYTKEILIDILKEQTKRLGRVPSSHDIKKPSSHTVKRIFGSWNKAVEEAGLIDLQIINLTKYNKIIHRNKLVDNYSKEDLIKHLHELYLKLNKIPRANDVRIDKTIPLSAYKKIFGSWKNAVIESGLNVKKERYIINKCYKIKCYGCKQANDFLSKIDAISYAKINSWKSINNKNYCSNCFNKLFINKI